MCVQDSTVSISAGEQFDRSLLQIEQVLGRGKTVGRIRQVMYRGLERVGQFFMLTQVGYNLMRIRTLAG